MQVLPFRAFVSAAARITHEVKQDLKGAKGVTTKRTFHMLHGSVEKIDSVGRGGREEGELCIVGMRRMFP